MFKTRLLSGTILVAILLLVFSLGGDVLLTFLGLISMIGLFEWNRLLKCEKSALAYVGYIGVLLYYLSFKFTFFENNLISAQWIMLFVIILMAMLGIYVFKFPKYQPLQILGSYFGVFYVGVFLSFVYQTRMFEHGNWFVWLIFIASWGCDTCAYCAGMLFGKHKMSPILSPKKTIEGAVGGILGTVILSAVYFMVMKQYVEIDANALIILAIAMVCAAFVSMIGDLAASAFKRQCDCKDYGKLIPGHGGILDRFDSVIFTAPIIYYLIYFII